MISFKNKSFHSSWNHICQHGVDKWQYLSRLMVVICLHTYAVVFLISMNSSLSAHRSYKNGKIYWVDSGIFFLTHVQPHLFLSISVGDPFSLKFRGFGNRWDPARGNILVSSVLSLNKSWSRFDLSERIFWGLTRLGQTQGTTRQLDEQATCERLWCHCLCPVWSYSLSRGLWQETLQ